MVSGNLRCLTALVWTVGAMVLSGCGAALPESGPPPAPEVTISRPVVAEVTDYLDFPGQTEAVGEVEVRARVTGYLVKINFQDGQEVKKGDVLFEIDPRPYKATLDRAAGELERAKALKTKAQASMNRAKKLLPVNAISQEDYEDCEAQSETARAVFESAQAAWRDAQLNLEFTRVLSPIDGLISRRRITEGNLVQSGSSDPTVLTTVVTFDPIYVCFNIEEPALLKFQNLDWRLGQDGRPHHIKELRVPVEVGLPSEEGFPHHGVLDFLDNKVNRSTGTIYARALLENAKRDLTPGLFVRVRVPFGKPHQAMLVSDRAVGKDQRHKYLLTVNKDQVVQRHEVKLGALHKGLRVIESGIGPNDLVIVNGLQRARPGAKVTPHFQEGSSGGAVTAGSSEKTAQTN